MQLYKVNRIGLGFLAVLIIGIGVALASSSITRTEAPPAPTSRPSDLGANLIQKQSFPSIGYGIHVSIWWNQTMRPRDLEKVRLMRFQYVKQIFGWRDIRPVLGEPDLWGDADAVVDEVEYRQLKLIARLGKAPTWAERNNVPPDEPPIDAAAFGQFCGDVAARYKGRIAGYQVWNEPNLNREWGGKTPNAAAYVKLLILCYKAIKAADPAAIVISAGLAPTGTMSPEVIPDDVYLLQLYQAGMKDYYDVLGLNAPGYKSPPETPPDAPQFNSERWQAFRHVEDMRAIMVQQGEGHKQVAILEMGWTVDQRDKVKDANGMLIPNPYRWHAVTEQEQAQFLTRAYAFAAHNWRPWISVIVAIYLPDPTWTPDNEEYWWSITEVGYDARFREAFFALTDSARYINDQYIPPLRPGENPYTPMPPAPGK